MIGTTTCHCRMCVIDPRVTLQGDEWDAELHSHSSCDLMIQLTWSGGLPWVLATESGVRGVTRMRGWNSLHGLAWHGVAWHGGLPMANELRPSST